MKIRVPILLIALLILDLAAAALRGEDWPQFRYDVGRTAASPGQLPAQLQLSWTRTLPAPRPAFPHELRLAYDASYEPVVLGQTMFVPSMVTDSVTALDTVTGDERWRFFAEGPVRFAPVAAEGKVYFVSDDGYLYCLDAADGALCWRFRGLPAGQQDRRVIGHGRFISLYPARGGPVLADGVVYFAAGLWPTEGVFVHAVDAQSGQTIWSNTEGNHIPASNWDHGVGQVAGLTPQGYLAVIGDRLIVPCGAQLPAFFDRQTGQLQKYTMGWGGRLGLPKGCWFVAGTGKYLSHGGDLYDITRPNEERLAKTKPGESDYKSLLYPGGWTRLETERANQRELDRFSQPVLTPEVLYESDLSITARELTDYTLQRLTAENTPQHRANDEVPDNFMAVFNQLWELPSKLQLHVKAGSRLYAGGPGVVQAVELAGKEPKVVWQAEIEGTPSRMLAADERLFVVTTSGSILAFAAPTPQGTAVGAHEVVHAAPSDADKWTEQARAILDATGADAGYALVLGVDTGRLIEELVRQSQLHVIAVDSDADKVATVRRRLFDLGWYGTRASVVVGDPVTYPFSPYFASLVVSETPAALRPVEGRSPLLTVFHTLRPDGGVACTSNAVADTDRIARFVQDASLPGATVREVGSFVMLTRSGALPGAADWSHAEANAASTGASEDELPGAPMAVLWFDAAERWHKYPGQVQVRVTGGRVILLEEGLLHASDVFTGRTMWEANLPIGAPTLADPAARESMHYARHRQWGPEASLPSDAELVAVADRIYLSAGRTCLMFDPATGAAAGQITLPTPLTDPWANLRVEQDCLVASSGAQVLCFDRHTGKLRWQVAAGRAGLSLAVGQGKVFCAEIADPRRGENPARDGSISALDLATGQRLWSKPGGDRLRYSPELDLVVMLGGLLRGRDGQEVTLEVDPPPAGFALKGRGLPEPGLPGFIAGTRLLTGDEQNLRVYELPTGQPLGKPLSWSRRGCTATRASTHLLTTRYRANSAWIDLDSREITPLLGIRPGCSLNNNLYPANGVLNIPSLTAGCTCNYAPLSTACVPAATVQ